MQIELTEAEQELLREVLQAERDRLLVEIRHTDHRDYKESLLKREELLEGLLSRLASQQVAP
jgi:hypothetical protein